MRVHSSDPPNPWENYLACISDLPAEASHVLVIQDDAIPCANFSEAVVAISERTSDPVCLFLGGLPAETAARARRAMLSGERLIPLGPAAFVPIVCVLWPVKQAQRFAFWARGRKLTRADDGNAAKWMRATKQQFLVAVPSLVEHDDSEPSVKGGRVHKPWQERWRFALHLSQDGSEFLSS